ncbi:hypothetical protein [Streptomyces sp. AC154]|uniref:hypothetical protein n=1 Tax=Streptomyces sp. AC154 TaxID=3143184 RepID=UPI003F7D61A1
MRHDDPAALDSLDLAWDPDVGVLGKLRSAVFDAELAAKYVALLNNIEVPEGESLNADFVRLVWFAPIFTEWQIDEVSKQGAERQVVVNFGNQVRERVMELLGTP